MIIKRIRLKNIRSYTDQEIVFPEGIVMLSGDIGAGKSSILLAIEFALFGFNRKTVTGDTLLRHGRHEGLVELEFLLKKHKNDSENPYHNIIIQRNIKRANQVKQEAGHIIIDGEKYDGTAVELKTRILGLLGYPQEMVTRTKDVIFKYTVYTPQEQMKQILMDKKEDRLETLRKVFNIDKYKRIAKNTSIAIKEMKQKKAELIGISADLEEKKKQLTEKYEILKKISAEIKELLPKHKLINEEIEKLNKELEENDKQLNILKEIMSKAMIERNKLDAAEQQKKENNERIVLLNNQIKELNKKIEEFKVRKPEEVDREKLKLNIEKDEKEIQTLKEKKINFEKEIEFNNKQIESVSNEIKEKKDLTKGIMQKKVELEHLEKELTQKDEVEKQIKSLDEEIRTLNLSKKEKEVNIDSSKKLKEKITSIDKCPTCLQDIDKDHKVKITTVEDKKIIDIKGDLDKLTKELKEKEDFFEKKQLEIRKLNEIEKTAAKLKAEFSTIEIYNNELMKKQKILEEYVKIRNKLSEEKSIIDNTNMDVIMTRLGKNKDVMDELKNYEEKLKQKQMMDDSLKEKNESLQSINTSITKFEEIIKQSRENIEKFNKELETNKKIEENYAKTKLILKETQEKERNIALSLAKLEQESKNTAEVIENLEKEITTKTEAAVKIARLTSFINWSDELFVNLMLSMEKHIMFRLHREFNEFFVEWFDVLLGEENLTVRLDDEFTPIIEQNGYETTMDHLSGGERSAVSLAYRLALNKVINSFITQINTKDIIILDEPTDGFSQEQIDKMKDVLDELNIKQIIIVSHEAKVESFAEHILRIAKREHVSCVV